MALGEGGEGEEEELVQETRAEARTIREMYDEELRVYPNPFTFYDEFKSCRPVNFTDCKTQPFHESSP